MDALLKGGTMLWTSHLGLIGGGKCSTYHWKILLEWYSLKHVKKVYWGTDIVWTSHLGLIGGEGSTFHWRILVEWYSLKHVKKVYWGTDIVWTSHLGLIGGGEFSSSHFIFIGQMDALLKGGTMLWTSHLGLIGGGKCSTYHWKILLEWYSLKHVKKVYWGTDIVWTSHLGLIGGGRLNFSLKDSCGMVFSQARQESILGNGHCRH